MSDKLGDHCKTYEQDEAGRRARTGLPLLARLDGHSFHRFTRGMPRPFSEGMSFCMRETTRRLVEKTHAAIGYTQSDEITLAWYFAADSPSKYLFDGVYQKLTSVLAGMATAVFNQCVANELPDYIDRLPHFDCRVWQVPTLADALDVFVWRQDEAVKNSISMAAQTHYSHRELSGKNSSTKLEMLHAKDIDWSAYPTHFTRGVHFQRRTSQRVLGQFERDRIPAKNRPAPDELVTRSAVVQVDLPPVRRIGNLIEVLFHGAEPTPREPSQPIPESP